MSHSVHSKQPAGLMCAGVDISKTGVGVGFIVSRELSSTKGSHTCIPTKISGSCDFSFLTSEICRDLSRILKETCEQHLSNSHERKICSYLDQLILVRAIYLADGRPREHPVAAGIKQFRNSYLAFDHTSKIEVGLAMIFVLRNF
ncbi:hypothetical protein WG66_000701 [Moniliophthora roreri]|nr:hypothetical protein WG66_000701 [Moniliophthora roreri]